jgi:hypothetical protein
VSARVGRKVDERDWHRDPRTPFIKSSSLAWFKRKPTQKHQPSINVSTFSFEKIWLVVSTPLKKISHMRVLFPIYWKNKIHVPNHQPEIVNSKPSSTNPIPRHVHIKGLQEASELRGGRSIPHQA